MAKWRVVNGCLEDGFSPRLCEEDVRNLIAAESISSMIARAEEHVYGSRPKKFFLDFMVRSQTIRAIFNAVPTTKLVEVVCADNDVGKRHGYRWYKEAIKKSWILPAPRLGRGDASDNFIHPDRDFVSKQRKLFQLHMKITQAAQAQMKNPFDLTAGLDVFDEGERKIYMHPFKAIIVARANRRTKLLSVIILGMMLGLGAVSSTVQTFDVGRTVVAATKSGGWDKLLGS